MVIDAAAQAAPLAEAPMSGGINGVEITLRTPAALAGLEVMAACDGLLAGPGRVRTDGMCASWAAPPGGA